MKKNLRVFATACMVIGLLWGTSYRVLAIETLGPGVFVQAENGYTLTPQGASKTPVAEQRAIDPNGNPTNYYVGTERFALTVTNFGEQNLVIMLSDETGVPTENNIVYIDQNTTGEFNLYPSVSANGAIAEGIYTVWVSQPGKALEKAATITSVSSAEKISYTLGNIDGDPNNTIDSKDALMLLQHEASVQELHGNALMAADVNRDADINSKDALMILQHEAGVLNINNVSGN